MNRLPKNFNAEEFVGKTLEQLGIGLFQTQLRFSGKIVVSIEGSVGIDQSKQIPVFEAGSILLKMIGKRVTKSSVLGEEKFDIIFENGIRLIIYDSNSTSESFSIDSPSGIVVV